ncbi:MAG: CoA-transferase [Oscillospiraceae bacterium]
MAFPKFITAEEAVMHVKDGDSVGFVGFMGVGHPEELSYNLEKRFLETGSPKNLTAIWNASQSNGKDQVGCDRLAHPGLVKRVIASHTGLQHTMAEMASRNEVEVFNFPLGVMIHLARARAGQKPCIITPVGLGTFADPREEGGKMNQAAIDSGLDLVSVTEVGGKEYLQYNTFDYNVVMLRGTTADEHGNITMEKEALLLEVASMAFAAKASGGIVIAQVERVVKAGTLDPRMVRLPGAAVDFIVKCTDVEKFHRQTYSYVYEPAFSGECKIPLDGIKPAPLDERKIIARRAALELKQGALLNLGIGIPALVSAVATEEKLSDALMFTVEPGIYGGVPAAGQDFGCTYNAEAAIDQSFQFDFYDGGGIDLSVLGMAELDGSGNVNTTKFGPRIVGPGGFVDIAQNTKTVVFTGTLTTGGLKIHTGDGKLTVLNEGKFKKLTEAVEQKTFSGEQARKTGQKVLYVTERAVFEMLPQGLTLTEIAPGIDLQTQVLDLISFKPLIAADLKLMDERIFRDAPMGIYDEVMAR